MGAIDGMEAFWVFCFFFLLGIVFSGLGCFHMDSWLKNQEIPCSKNFVCFYVRFHVYQYIYFISLNE